MSLRTQLLNITKRFLVFGCLLFQISLPKQQEIRTTEFKIFSGSNLETSIKSHCIRLKDVKMWDQCKKRSLQEQILTCQESTTTKTDGALKEAKHNYPIFGEKTKGNKMPRQWRVPESKQANRQTFPFCKKQCIDELQWKRKVKG